MIAIWATLVLTVAALTAAMSLAWNQARRAEPVRCRVESCGCYPKVQRWK